MLQASVDETFRICVGSGQVAADELLQARAAPPTSAGGVGLRDLADVSCATSSGGCWQAHHRSIPRRVDGSVQPVHGHAPWLESVSGAGAFDAHQGRHAGLLEGTSRLGQECREWGRGVQKVHHGCRGDCRAPS